MRSLDDAMLNPFRAVPETTPNAQAASALDASMQKEKARLEFGGFPNPSTFAFWKVNFRSDGLAQRDYFGKIN